MTFKQIRIQVKRRITAIRGLIFFEWDRLRVHYLVHVDPKAKCPACGMRKRHEIRWSLDFKALIHACKLCGANWTEQPIVKADAWVAVTIVEEQPGVREERPPMTVQRQPIVVKG